MPVGLYYIIDMNYYAKLYKDDYNLDDIEVHIQIIEGIYESNLRQKARVIGDVNITENSFCKYVKQPYDVINVGEHTITLKKRFYNMETNSTSFEKTYTLLSHLLTTEGHTPERIAKISSAIYTISNDISIKTNQSCIGDWVKF